MFEHLNEQSTLTWRERIRYFSAAALVVSAVFFLSLWLIAKAANYFGVTLPFQPVEVTYDADEDGLLLNEVVEDPQGDVPTESEKASPPLSTTADGTLAWPPHGAGGEHGRRPDKTEHSLQRESRSQTPDPSPPSPR